MTPEQLNAIKERANKATNVNNSGWCVDEEYPDIIREAWDHELIAQVARGKEVDAVFIAHARQDIPELIAEVERLNHIVDTYRSCGHLFYADQHNGLSFTDMVEVKLAEEGVE